MFFLVMASLVILSDPQSPFSSSVVKRVESQLAPSQEKLGLPVIPAAVKVQKESGSLASHLFYKGHISTESSSVPTNHAHKNMSALSAASSSAIPFSSSKIETSKSNVRGENKSTFGASLRDDEMLQSSHYIEDSTSPLVLKLDKVYTPLEIAEYIFTTGDEKGFAQGVGEMLEDGEIMTSRDDVLLFLEGVERELANLRRLDATISGPKE